MVKDMNSDKNNMHINLSTSGEKIKYYDYDDDTCVFEILDDESNFDNIDIDPLENNLNSMENYNIESENPINNIKSSFGNIDMEYDPLENNLNSMENYNIESENLINNIKSSFDNIDMEYDPLENDLNSMENCNIESQNSINNIKSSFESCKSDMQEYHTSNNSEFNAFNYYNNSCRKVKGEIVVISAINCGSKNEYLEGVKINLYKLNGVCPVFIESCLTNRQGKAVFINLPEGCYRVIAIVNKNYFEKPKYVNWNEVNINRENTNAKVLVMNNLKKNCRNNFRYR
ncbi:prealbumin-like fold domain-containing protein [uncultured Clostridium sp.]|uniref:prealbumin-like fold domain-containing protein n=1 Tax=uncultured Clostridium sp. TaxID=59620 RepID=UPI0028EC7FD7|nr:prealbumin-like fold domain-containing protein [uncultured Clostridium sp.]